MGRSRTISVGRIVTPRCRTRTWWRMGKQYLRAVSWAVMVRVVKSCPANVCSDDGPVVLTLEWLRMDVDIYPGVV